MRKITKNSEIYNFLKNNMMALLEPGIGLTTLQHPVSALSLPLFHYIFLQRMSPFLATLPIGLFIFFIPLIHNYQLIHPSTCCLFIGIMFKTFDAALLDRSVIQSLTFMQYIKYLTVYKLPRKFERKLTTEKKISALDAASIKYKDLFSLSHYIRLAVEVVAKLGFSFIIFLYLNRNRPNWHPEMYSILDPTNFSPENLLLFKDNFLFGFALMFMLEVGGNVVNLLSAIFFKSDYKPMMNAPYFATSIRDFWVKWNLIVQRGLRRIIFDPIIFVFGYGNASGKVPSGVLLTAAICTFAFSGLFHQWIIYCLCKTPSWEQMIFFMIHGIVGMIEIIVLKIVKSSTGIHLGKIIPKPIAIIYTLSVLIITCPLFNGPWIREGIFERLYSWP
jgi:Membrane bound O-acyl transferase family